ncbi:MAG: FtsX-like permease family protein [Woeseia sp.]
MHILDRKLVRDLWTFRGQASSIVLVLACAAAAMSMSFSVQRSLDATREDYYRRYGFADLFASVPHAPLSLAETIRGIPGVAAVAARIAGHGAISIDGFDEPITGRLMSLPENGDSQVNALALRQGRSPAPDHGGADSPPDRPREVIISESFAAAHGLRPGSRLTMTIGGHRRVLTVAGIALSPEYIYAVGPGQIVPDNHRFGIVWMERLELAADLGLPDQFNDLAVRLSLGASAAGVTETLDRLLAPYGGTDIHDRTQQYSHAFVSNQLKELGAIGVLVPAIFLGVAVFLLHASMLRIIALQRVQIGIIKALGFAGRTIGWHYVKFALALAGAATVLGLPVGIALGYGMTRIYAEFFHFPFLHYGPDMPAVAGVVAVLACAATLAALHPAGRAAALRPAVAMLPALPVAYRRSAGGRLARRLTAPAAMVLRQLGRRPLRPVLTTATIAFAVGLQIATLFSFDALDEMVDVFYARAQRQDATIVFAAPVPAAVLADIARWPGVRAVDGRRDMPARLSVAGASRHVVLTGLPAGGTLHRLLDLALVPIPVPGHGIALSRRLATILHARVGDRVTVDSATGRSFELPVTALVEQYIGMGAYMELAALDRLLGDGSIVTGAEVKLAGDDGPRFHRALKDSPIVAGFVPRLAAVTAFRETMARTLTIIVSFFVAFAGIAAFAIVDATVRVALSERVRELAIMRALGFDTGTIVFMLAGELVVAVVAALPLGSVVGLGLGQLIVWNLDNDLFHVPLVVGWRSYAIAGGTALAAATVSFALAARRLRGIDIPAALRVGAT